MKVRLAGMVLALFAGAASAQVGGLVDAEISEQVSITDPARLVQEAEGKWFAFSMPVLKGSREPCCWKGKWSSKRSGSREVGCSLEQQSESYGRHSDSPLAENVIAYAAISEGKVRSLRVLGEHCPVDGGGATLTWIGKVDEGAGLDWLDSVARTSGTESVAGTALYAMAMHRSDDATGRLMKMALDTDGEQQNEAIFWLGDSRGTDGLTALTTLLAGLPQGDARREINFALSLNGTQDAIDLLSEISRSDKDPEQRGGALFWLADAFPAEAPELLLQALDGEQDEAVLEQAVFAISQLPDERSTRMLLELARDERKPREVRRQALFWLANSEDDRAVTALVELLTR